MKLGKLNRGALSIKVTDYTQTSKYVHGLKKVNELRTFDFKESAYS